MSEKLLLEKIKRNKRMNLWWLNIFGKAISRFLKNKMPEQTIGIFLNPYTSNQERIKILKNFKII